MFSPAQAVKYTADSVKALRPADLERLFSQNCETRTHQDKVIAYLAKHRPDLADAIADCLIDTRIAYTAAEFGKYLKANGINVKVKRQVYSDDGAVVIIRADDTPIEQLRVAHSYLTGYSTELAAAWVVIRRDGSVIAVYPGNRPAPAASELTPGVRVDYL